MLLVHVVWDIALRSYDYIISADLLDLAAHLTLDACA
jgi:hypothetical protein